MIHHSDFVELTAENESRRNRYEDSVPCPMRSLRCQRMYSSTMRSHGKRSFTSAPWAPRNRCSNSSGTTLTARRVRCFQTRTKIDIHGGRRQRSSCFRRRLRAALHWRAWLRTRTARFERQGFFGTVCSGKRTSPQTHWHRGNATHPGLAYDS